jgi:hypothetical protein
VRRALAAARSDLAGSGIAAIAQDPGAARIVGLPVARITTLTRAHHRPRRPGRRAPTYDLVEYLLRALRAGACGFLLNDVPAELVPGAGRAAASGDTLISGGPTRRLVEAFLPVGRERSARLRALSERERQVLVLIAAGRSTARSPPNCTSARRR